MVETEDFSPFLNIHFLPFLVSLPFPCLSFPSFTLLSSLLTPPFLHLLSTHLLSLPSLFLHTFSPAEERIISHTSTDDNNLGVSSKYGNNAGIGPNSSSLRCVHNLFDANFICILSVFHPFNYLIFYLFNLAYIHSLILLFFSFSFLSLFLPPILSLIYFLLPYYFNSIKFTFIQFIFHSISIHFTFIQFNLIQSNFI